MDTTQKNREQPVRSSREDAPRQSRPQRPPQEEARRKQRPPQEEGQQKQRPPREGDQRSQRPPQEAAQRPRPSRPEGETPRAQTGAAQQRRPAASGKTAKAASARKETRAPAKRKKRSGVKNLLALLPVPGRKASAERKAARTPEQKPAQRPARKRAEEVTDLSTKKRAYGNSKPKKKSTFAVARDLVKSTARKMTSRTKSKKSGNRSGQPAPAIIYTQPKTFSRTRLLIQMLTVAAVVAAMVAGLSVFFKVENITVSGAEVYSAWSIREASGIQEGDNLLTFSHARAGALIKANLPYVKTVRFGIKLPDTVNIIIEEESVVYAVEDSTGTWWLMNSDGRVVEQTNKSKAANYTQVLGFTLENPAPDKQAVATEIVLSETIPQETGETIQTGETAQSVPTTTTGAKRLSTAMAILDALEANDIVGEAASVDVSRLEDIILWYGSRYQVNLGDSTNLEYKIACMNDVILQLSEFDSGILDVSFTVWPDQVIYTPFA